MDAAIINFFVGANLVDPSGVEAKRARIGVTVILVAMFWALIAGSLAIVTGSYSSAAVLLLGTAVVGTAPFVLRATGNLSLAGHLVVAPVYVVLLWTIYENGGLYAPPIVWLSMLPLMASLFQGHRVATVWLGIVVLSLVAILVAMLMDFPFPPIISPEAAHLQFGIALVGMGITAFVLLQLNNNVRNWLADVLREKEAETRAVLETAPDGILTVRADGQILSANRATARIFGCSREQILAHDIGDIIPSIGSDSLASALESKRFGETLEHVGQRAGVGAFPLEIAFGRHEDRLVLVLRDITDRMEADAQLRHARDVAVEANRAKSEFLANMSHELRTPLNAVIGYSEMIHEEIEAMRDDKLESGKAVTGFLPDLARIRAAGKHLLVLISDVLDLSKVEAGRMELDIEKFDLAELVEEIEQTLSPLAVESNDTLTVELGEELGSMYSDATKVRQILYNLLSNACKFTQDGSVILRAFPDEDDSAQIVFEVEDTGIGMSGEQIERVFDAFIQADSSTTRRFGGTGLGLSITRHFCTLLGGSIRVESQLDRGSLFRVRLAADMRPGGADLG